MIDGLHAEVCHWDMDADNLLSVHIHHFHVFVSEDVLAHFITIDGVPEICESFVDDIEDYQPSEWISSELVNGYRRNTHVYLIAMSSKP